MSTTRFLEIGPWSTRPPCAFATENRSNCTDRDYCLTSFADMTPTWTLPFRSALGPYIRLYISHSAVDTEAV